MRRFNKLLVFLAAGLLPVLTAPAWSADEPPLFITYGARAPAIAKRIAEDPDDVLDGPLDPLPEGMGREEQPRAEDCPHQVRDVVVRGAEPIGQVRRGVLDEAAGTQRVEEVGHSCQS